MTTRPTTDGDTANAVEVIRRLVSQFNTPYDTDGLAALVSLTTRLTEQDAALSTARRTLQHCMGERHNLARRLAEADAYEAETTGGIGWEAWLDKVRSNTEAVVRQRDAARRGGVGHPCARCGTTRDENDLAWIDDTPYCHPANSTDDTCYMAASRHAPDTEELENERWQQGRAVGLAAAERECTHDSMDGTGLPDMDYCFGCRRPTTQDREG